MARAESREKDTKGLMFILTRLSKGTPLGSGSGFSGDVPGNLIHRRVSELLAQYKAQDRP